MTLTVEQVREALEIGIEAIECVRNDVILGPIFKPKAEETRSILRRLLESGFPMPPAVRAVCEEMREYATHATLHDRGQDGVADWLKRIEEAYE